MSAIERARDAARANPPRVVFPEEGAEVIAAARERLEAEGLANCLPPDGDDAALEKVLVEQRGLKPAIARRMLTRPLYRAAASVAAGRADLMVAGAETPTRRVIEAAAIAIGLADGVSLPSSFFLMRMRDGAELLFADCAVNVTLDAEGLSAVARATAHSAQALLGRADVALLSYSTGTSGVGPSVDTVRAAAEATGLTGPVQADAALNPRIAGAKGLGSGQANALVFPTLDAGNIAYKLMQELAGAQAVGPVLQGFRRPVCDLSRGAAAEDVVAATVLAAALG